MSVSRIWFLRDAFAVFVLSLLAFALVRICLSTVLPLMLFLGITAFILLPGYFAATIIHEKTQIDLDMIGYSLIFGLAIQMLILAVDFILNAVVLINFDAVLFGGSIIAVAILRIGALRLGIRVSSQKIKSAFSSALQSRVTSVFIFALALRILYSSVNVMSIAPDGSLYASLARTAASTGRFGADIFNDAIFSANPYLVSQGLIPHAFVAFALSLFFGISGFAMRTALWLVLICGSLVVYPIHSLTQRLFGRDAALLASLLVAIDPVFLLFSSILYGPEIIGLLFLLSSIYILVEGAERNSSRLILVSGVLFGVSEEFWFAYFYIALLTMVVAFFVYNRSYHHLLPDWKILLASAIPIGLFAFGLKVYSLYFIFLPIVVSELFALVFATRLKSRLLASSLCLPAGAALATLPYAIRSYLTPLQVNFVLKNSGQSLLASVTGAFAALIPAVSLQGISNYLEYLYSLTTPALLVLFLLSFAVRGNLGGKTILAVLFVSDLILVSFTPPPTYPLYLFSFARFLLLPMALAIIGAGSLLDKVSKAVMKAPSPRIFGAAKHDNWRKIITIGVAFCLILAFFVPLYPQGENAIVAQNPLREFGWSSNMLNWIMNQTGSDSSIISARPRELNLFANRRTVDISNPGMDQNDINFTWLASMITRFNVSYVQVDGYFDSVFPSLSYLYHSINLPLGTKVVPPPVLKSFYATGNESGLRAYELVEEDVGPKVSDGIWMVLPPTSITLTSIYRDSLSASHWKAGNGGILESENNSTVLTIGQNRTYTYTYGRTPLNITFPDNLERLLVWNLTQVQGARVDRIEIWGTNGTRVENIVHPDEIGLWVQNLVARNIGDIRVVISGVPGGHIGIAWIELATLEFTPD